MLFRSVLTLVKNDARALTLAGVNTYSGNTTINGGAVYLGSSTALPSTTVLTLTNSSLVDLQGNSISLQGLSSSDPYSAITSSSGAPTLTVNISSDYRYDGQLLSTLGLSKGGTGTLSLGASSVSGDPASSTNFSDRKSTRLNSSHIPLSRMPSSA